MLLHVFLILGLFFMPVRSTVLSKAKGSNSFSIDSTDSKTRTYWMEEIMDDFEQRDAAKDSLAVNAAIDEALVLWDAIDRKSIARIKNFDLLSSSEQAKHPSKVEYYLGNAFGVFSRRCPEWISYSLFQIFLENDDQLSFYLADAVVASDIQGVFALLLRFIDNNMLKHVKKIVAKYPLLVNRYFDYKEQKLTLTPLGYVLYHQKIEFIDYFMDETDADVNAKVVVDPEYGRIPLVFLTLTEGQYYFTAEFLDKFNEHPAFKPELAIDSQDHNAVYYAIKKGLHLSGFEQLIRIFDWQRSFDPSSSICDAFTYALSKGRTDLASMITFHPDFNYAKVDEAGQTYLMMATRANAVDTIIELLLEGKRLGIFQLRPGFASVSGQSALGDAVCFKSYDALKVLVKEASEHEINCAVGINPLAMAISLHDEQAVSIILTHPQISLDILVWPLAEKVDIMNFAVRMGNSEIIKKLKERISS